MVFESSRFSGLRRMDIDENGQLVLVGVSTQESQEAAAEEKLLPGKAYPNKLKLVLTQKPDQNQKLVTVTVKVTNQDGSIRASRKKDVLILNHTQSQKIDNGTSAP